MPLKWSQPSPPSASKFVVPVGINAVLGLAGIGIAGLLSTTIKGGPKAQAALVVPKEFHTTNLQYANWNEAADIVQGWLEATHQWFTFNVGYFMDIDFRLVLSQHTWSEFKGANPGDACGNDFDFVNAFSWLPLECGWNMSPPFKHWYVVVGAGGWAGANTSIIDPLGMCSGTAVLGDYNLRNALGQHSPCDTVTGGDTSCRPLGHEICHTLNMEVHTPVTWCGDPLQPFQKDQFVEFNHLWGGH